MQINIFEYLLKNEKMLECKPKKALIYYPFVAKKKYLCKSDFAFSHFSSACYTISEINEQVSYIYPHKLTKARFLNFAFIHIFQKQ